MRRFFLRLTILGASAAAIGCAFDAASKVPATAAQTVPVATQLPGEYTLGPGDQISIHVTELDDVSDKAVRIDPNGIVDLPLIGRVTAGGLTVEQFREALAAKLAKYIQSPQIAINVLEYHSQPVSILGAVNAPGVQQLQGPKRLLEVISVAGGLKPEAGARLTITRQIRWGALPLPGAHADQSGQYSVGDISIDELTREQNPQANIFVRPNDTITVPKADIVYVLGQVKRAGGYPITSKDSLSLLKALALAEGLDRDAAPKHARIIRSGGTTGGAPPTAADANALRADSRSDIPVDLKSILEGKSPDQQLHADDVLFIPDSVSRSATRRSMEALLQMATGLAIYRF